MPNTLDRNPGIEGPGLYRPFDTEIHEAHIRTVLAKLSTEELESARLKYASFPSFDDRGPDITSA